MYGAETECGAGDLRYGAQLRVVETRLDSRVRVRVSFHYFDYIHSIDQSG